MTGGGKIQAERNGQKFSAEEKSDEYSGTESSVPQRQAFLSQDHQASHQYGGEERSQANLEDGTHARGRGFDGDLLQPPARAEPDHDRGSKAIEWLAKRRGRGLVHPPIV